MPNRLSTAKRCLCLFFGLLFCLGSARAAAPRVLFFSKAASWEQKIVHRDGLELSYLEREVEKLGQEYGIDFTFSKDGTIFTAENLARFDALMFFTSGDLTSQARNGRGDNFPLMTLEGKQAFLDAIRPRHGIHRLQHGQLHVPRRLEPRRKEQS